MASPEARGEAGGLSLGSHTVSRNAGASREYTSCSSRLAWAESGEEVVQLSRGRHKQSMLLIEDQLYIGMLSTHLKFKTHKYNFDC